MSSTPFKKVLTATGFLDSDGNAVPGLTQVPDEGSVRLRAVLRDGRVGLNADAVFSVQGSPSAIFKDSGTTVPTDVDVQRWHEAAWNIGVAPLLWIITPIEVKLYNCYASPPRTEGHQLTLPLDTFTLSSDEQLRNLDAMCG